MHSYVYFCKQRSCGIVQCHVIYCAGVAPARERSPRMLTLSLRLLQRISLSSAVSDARCSLSRSLLWRNLSSDRCHVRCDSRSVIGERGRSSFSMVVNDSGAILTMKKKLQVLRCYLDNERNCRLAFATACDL